jgi:C-terminal processing protease CtpA/Prc
MESNGKVAVIKFNGFSNLTYPCGTEVTRTFDVVANADALIFDLRENTGGDARMVAFISSYLFDKRTHLNDVLTRRKDASGRQMGPDEFSTQEFWANDPEVPGRKYGGTKPVYVLTSGVTFSAAEEFTYNLKALKRATIVGEPTGGGAHPTRGEPIDDQFSIGVPFARSVNPITKTNWEGTGVTPDVTVPAAQALETAMTLIAQKARRQ